MFFKNASKRYRAFIYIFLILTFIPLANCGIRQNCAWSPNPSSIGLYDKLKETFAPILAEKIDLSDNNNEQFRFKKQTKPLDDDIENSQIRLLKEAVPANMKYDINTILVTHRGNESLLSKLLDPEHDYDYDEQDSRDIEEPTNRQHIFLYSPDYNGALKSLKYDDNINPVQAKVNSLSLPLAVNKEIAGKFDHNYEKCSEHLAPLVKPSEMPLKLEEKLLTPYEKLVPFMQERKPDFVNSTTAYNSLYDEFKKRLQDFSTELGIDAGLESLGKEPNETKKTWPAIQDIFANANKTSLDIVDSSIKKRENTQSYNKRIQQNPSRIYAKPSTKNNFGPDFDFWLQQRGYPYRKRGKVVVNRKGDGRRVQTLGVQTKPKTQKRFFRGVKLNNVFPDVLVEPLQTQAGETVSKITSRGVLDDVAGKLNMSTLEVAKKIADIKDLNLQTLTSDPELHRTLKQYIQNSVLPATQIKPPPPQLPRVQTQIKNMTSSALAAAAPSPTKNYGFPWELPKAKSNPISVVVPNTKKDTLNALVAASDTANNNGCPWEQAKTMPNPSLVAVPFANETKISEDQVSNILEKLMAKLNEIEYEKLEKAVNDKQDASLEDTPCKINGPWISKELGLLFDLNLRNTSLGPREAQNFGIKVNVREAVPPRQHNILDTSWPFTGAALKRNGGPFYLYTQKQSENTVATFVGYCRTCNKRDTIFGTWSFALPAKSCLETAASFQTKNDVMHRYVLDEKRQERYKDLMFKKSGFSRENH